MTASRGHKLLTAYIKKHLPPLYSQENVPDPIVQVKFFSPYSNWRWFGFEFDGEDTFFGYVQGFESELGYFSLKELDEVTTKVFGVELPAVERDTSFEPKPLSEVKRSLAGGGGG